MYIKKLEFSKSKSHIFTIIAIIKFAIISTHNLSPIQGKLTAEEHKLSLYWVQLIQFLVKNLTLFFRTSFAFDFRSSFSETTCGRWSRKMRQKSGTEKSPRDLMKARPVCLSVGDAISLWITRHKRKMIPGLDNLVM